MKSASLFLSSMAYQLARDPLDLANKVSVRLRGQAMNSHATFAPLGGSRKRDFDVPILTSSAALGEERVLQVLTNSLPFSHGGYAHRSHELLRALNSGGFEASAITRLGYPAVIGRWPSRETDVIDNVEYSRALPTWHPLSFSRSIRAQANLIVEEAVQRRAGVLHTTTPWPNAAATSIAAQILGIPWVYEVRGEPESTWAAAQPHPEEALASEFYQSSKSKETEAMLAAATVVVLSEVSLSEVRSRGVGRAHIIPNSVREAELSRAIPPEDARAKLGLGSGPFIGAVSSIVDYEGFDNVVCALPYLPENVKALFVGDGSALPALKELAAELGVRDRVAFAGRQAPEEITDWYCALDVFVAPRKDTRVTRVVTPMKMQRAQSFGIPVVCSDLPALREVTGGEAFYIPPDDPRALADTVLRALDRGRETRAPSQISTWEMGASRLIEMYRDLS